eukprot:3959076-Amphidinium_carterae.3
MPPLDPIKTLCSLCMTLGVSPKGKPLKLALWDISCARLYGDAQRDLYVELLPEDEQLESDTEPMCGLLLRSMYGTQDASQIWQKDYAKLLGGKPWKQGDSNGALFYDTVSQARAVMQRDNLLLLGDEDDILKLDETLRSRSSLSLRLQVRWEVTYLNRVIRYVKGPTPRLEIEHDMRHLDYLMRDLGLDGTKVQALDCPSVKVGMQEIQRWIEEQALEAADCTRYRSGVMRIAYKRVGRYLHSHRCLVNVYHKQKWPGKVTVVVDTDFAGDQTTRKSTT